MRTIILLLFLVFLVGCSSTGNVIEDDYTLENHEDCENYEEHHAVEVDCPMGLVEDEYPGSCGMYVDSDNNDICDLSE